MRGLNTRRGEMNSDKAIKKLERHQEGDSRCCHPELYDAIRLGREALQRLDYIRTHPWDPTVKKLPSETKN